MYFCSCPNLHMQVKWFLLLFTLHVWTFPYRCLRPLLLHCFSAWSSHVYLTLRCVYIMRTAATYSANPLLYMVSCRSPSISWSTPSFLLRVSKAYLNSYITISASLKRAFLTILRLVPLSIRLWQWSFHSSHRHISLPADLLALAIFTVSLEQISMKEYILITLVSPR